MSVKRLDYNGVLYLWQKIKSYVATQLTSYVKTSELPAQYTLPVASSSALGGVKVGSGFTISADGTISNNYGGTADSVAWSGVTGKPTTLTGYGITNAYTKTEVDAKISSTYKPSGSVAFASLPYPDSTNLGNVYNVTDEFTTISSFVEGSGKVYPANSNVAVVLVDGSYKFDVLSGFVDLSSYAKTSDFTAITNAEIDAIIAS